MALAKVPVEIESLPNPFWIVPVFEWLAREPRTDGDEGATTKRLLGAGILAAQVIDDFLEWDLRFDVALGLESDDATDTAFGFGAEKIWPRSSERGRAWTRLWMLADDFRKAKTPKRYAETCRILNDELISGLRKAYNADHRVAPHLRGKLTKESLLRTLAIYRFDIVTHRGRTLLGMELPPPGADKPYKHFLEEPEAPHRSRLPAYLGVLGDLIEHLGDKRLANAIRRTRGGDVFAAFERHDDAVKLFVNRAPLRQVRPPDASRFTALRQAMIEPPQALKENFEFRSALSEHPLEILDEEESGASALGAELCTSVIIGELQQKSTPLRILRIEHDGPGGWTSFCVLIERYTTMNNRSAWLTFVRVGGAATGGFSSGEYARVMDTIEEHASRVSMQTIPLRYAAFRAILTKRHPWRDVMRQREAQRQALGGRMIEFLTRDLLDREGYATSLGFRDHTILGTMEVDIVAVHHEIRECLVVECTASWKPETDALELQAKVKGLRRKYPEYAVRGILVIPARELNDPRHRRSSLDPPWPETPERNTNLWILERDILPRLPNEYRKDHIIANFGALALDHYEPTDDG